MARLVRADTAILGGGTAGCVLANRLSANPGHTVAMIEAGPDFGHTAENRWPPPIALAGTFSDAYDWGYQAIMAGKPYHYIRGKVVGGSSAINASGANIGIQADYDRWRDLGNPGWGFDDLLPYFLKAERLENDRQPGRGTDGAVSVSRMWGGSLFTADLAAVAAEVGIPPVADISGPYVTEGSGLMTRTLRDGRRAHAALAYLDEARARPNLQIVPDTLIDVLDWSDGRVTHARAFAADGEPVVIEADRFVLAAGAVGSPILLQRSGIGPEELLHHLLGPQTRVHHLPGVGRNLHDHFGAQLLFQATDDAFDHLTPPDETRPRVSFAVRLKSRPDLDAYDLDVFTAHASTRPPRRDDEVMVFYVFLVHPEAEGSIEITSRDPHAPPMIQTGFGLDADIDAIARGIEWVRDRLATPTMRRWIAHERQPGAAIAGAALRAWARDTIHPFHHPTGTCKLGPDSDPMAVVDASGAVRGFTNLFIADASIMPTIPRGMIIMTVYALAEKIAAGLAG